VPEVGPADEAALFAQREDDLFEEQRVAVALRVQPAAELVADRPAEQRRGEPRRLLPAQRLEPQVLDPRIAGQRREELGQRLAGRDLVGAVGSDQDQRQLAGRLPELPHQVAEELEARRVGRVQVLQAEQHGPAECQASKEAVHRRVQTKSLCLWVRRGSLRKPEVVAQLRDDDGQVDRGRAKRRAEAVRRPWEQVAREGIVERAEQHGAFLLVARPRQAEHLRALRSLDQLPDQRALARSGGGAHEHDLACRPAPAQSLGHPRELGLAADEDRMRKLERAGQTLESVAWCRGALVAGVRRSWRHPCAVSRWAAAPVDGLFQPGGLFVRQAKRFGQHPHGVALGPEPEPALQVADAPRAEVRPFGERLLRQAGGQAELPQQLRERRRPPDCHRALAPR
jgi:hypothetical protein